MYHLEVIYIYIYIYIYIKNINLLKSLFNTKRRSYGEPGKLPLPQAPPRKTPKSAVELKKKHRKAIPLVPHPSEKSCHAAVYTEL